MKRQWSTVLLIALILVIVIFSVLNVDPVFINLGFDTFQIPLAVVLIGSLLIGVLMTTIFSTMIVIRDRNKQKKLEQEITRLKEEADEEKQKLNQQHQEEKQSLQKEMDKKVAKVRELERRISNMKSTQAK